MRYRAHNFAFWAAIFLEFPPSAVFFLLISLQKLIRSSKIPGGPPRHNLNTIQPRVHKISRPQTFRAAVFFKISSVSYLVFNELSLKHVQINQND